MCSSDLAISWLVVGLGVALMWPWVAWLAGAGTRDFHAFVAWSYAKFMLQGPAGARGSPGSPKVVYGEAAAWGRGKRDETRIAPISTEGSSPALVKRQTHASCKSVASVSGGGLGAVPCGSHKALILNDL